jgi:hypothetical protein
MSLYSGSAVLTRKHKQTLLPLIRIHPKKRLIPRRQRAKKAPTEAKEAMPTGHACRPQNGQTEKAA